MNREPSGPAVPGNEDSWESLAEDLFGIEFHKTSDAGHVIPPDELSLEEPSEPAVVETESSPPPGSPEHAASTPSAGERTDESRSGEESRATEELRPPGKARATVDEPAATVAQETPPEIDRGSEPQGESEAEESGTSDGTSDEDDSYWDALNEWDWSNSDESPPVEKQQKPASRSRTEQPSRSRPATPPLDQSAAASRGDSTVADFRDEYVQDVGFGAGLLEDEDLADVESPPVPRKDESLAISSAAGRAVDEAVSDDTSSTRAGSSPEAEAEPEVRKRRRRRPRRSRSAGRKPLDTESAVPGPADETRNSEEGAVDESAVASDGSEAAEGDKLSGEEADRPKRPSRRRRPRRRKKSETAKLPEPDDSDEEQVADSRDDRAHDDRAHDDRAHDDRADDDRADDDRADDDRADDDRADDDRADDDEELDDASEETTPTYRNVPTWEQAISYLLHPEQRDAKSPKAQGHAHSKSKSGGSKTGERRSRRRR